MDWKTYADIQRSLGIIEGASYGGNGRAIIDDAVNAIDNAINKLMVCQDVLGREEIGKGYEQQDTRYSF